MQVIKSICGMCGADVCGIDVHIEDGRIAAIRGTREHPVNRGRLCPQGPAALDLVNDPTRLRHPLRRDGDGWQRITWDEALEIIARKLQALKTSEGPQALAVYQGRGLLQFLKAGWPQRFLHLYGSPNLVRNDHMCAYPVAIAERLTYGATTVYGPDPEHAACLLLWGSNPATSHIPFTWHDVLAARRRGCRLIVIDPRRTAAAEQADIHLSLRPGTDAALALSFLNVIIAEGLYDASFVETWTIGFDRLAERVAPYTPEAIAEITGANPDAIRAAARLYATARPAHLEAGNALEHHNNSIHALRAVMILRAITGNLDVPGGNVLLDRLPLADMTLPELRPTAIQPLGADRYPIFLKYAGFVPGDALLDAILDEKPYPVRALIVAGGNPALTWPNSRRVAAALEKLDFLAVMDLHMTATARYADLVLPAAYSLEKTQLVLRSGPFGTERPQWYALLSRAALPSGECWSDWQFWAELGRRMGYGAYYPWADEVEATDALLAPTGITAADLLASPDGLFCGAPHVYGGYKTQGFNTPSGKVELSSTALEAAGYGPLPGYVEPAESPVSSPAVAERYPLVLMAGRRSAAYTHSRHRQIARLHRLDPEPLAEVHPVTAHACSVADGDPVEVASPRGAIRLPARVTPDVHPGVVSLLHGWEEANANLLTDDGTCDPVLACPPLRSGLCSIRSLAGQPAL